MAPLSHLLAYYVRENGEGVTDSLQIPIQSDFENQVCIILKNDCRVRVAVCPNTMVTRQDVQWQSTGGFKSAEMIKMARLHKK